MNNSRAHPTRAPRAMSESGDASGAAAPAPTPSTPLGPYTVLHELGRGQLGIVLACWDARLERKVAVKILRTDRRSPAIRERMLREARAMAKLSHPNVAQVYEVGEADGRVFVAMEYIAGKTLGQWARARAHAWPEVLALALAAARGLAAAHAHGLVHRDFKPENVMVDGDGRARVLDFGLVRFEDRTTFDDDAETADHGAAPTLTRRGVVLGTPAYMAPEQILDAQSGPAADQYAFCVSLWELLFGARPFAAPYLEPSGEPVRRGRPDPGANARAVPRWLRRALERGLAEAPGDRHASMHALIRALERGPLHARLRGLAAIAAGAGVAGLAYGGIATFDRERRTHACHERAEAWLAGTTSIDDATAGLRATQSPVADATAVAVAPFLGAQLDALRTAAASTCVRAEVERTASPDLHDRATWCLDERKSELAAVLDAFARADVELLDIAVAEASNLATVADCLDDDALLRSPAPPTVHRESVRALQAELAGHRVAMQGDVRGRAAQLLATADAVDAAGWDPLRARLRLLLGRAAWFDGELERARRDLADAYFIALETRDWSTAARAAIAQIELTGRWLRRRDEALAWGDHAGLAIAKAADPLGLREAIRLVAIASVHEIEGEVVLARMHVERALAIEESQLPADHPRLAARLDLLGVIAGHAGDYETMTAACSRALAIRESLFGEHHGETMESVGNVGAALQSTGEYARAQAFHERALAIATRTQPPGSLVFGTHHANLAVALSGLGEHARARSELELALAIREAVLGAEHPSSGKIRRMLGEALLAAGDLDGARVQLEHALRIHEAALGPMHVDVAEHLQLLARVHALAGARATVDGLEERALAIVVAATGEGSLEHASALERDVFVQRDVGQLERARRSAERCVAIREHLLGSEHPSTAFTIAVLGEQELELGELASARRHLERAAALFEGHAVVSDAEHETSFALARIIGATNGDLAHARALAERARDAWRELGRGGADDVALAEAWLQEHPLP